MFNMAVLTLGHNTNRVHSHLDPGRVFLAQQDKLSLVTLDFKKSSLLTIWLLTHPFIHVFFPIFPSTTVVWGQAVTESPVEKSDCKELKLQPTTVSLAVNS